MRIEFQEQPEALKKDPKEVLEGPIGFGKVFCDRMFSARWSKDRGWYDAAIGPYRALQLDPAALVLHYAQEIFEGLKAYRHPDGKIGLFRPERNARRMNNSAARMVMPEMPEEDQLQAMESLVKELADWVPRQEGYALYLRPTMIGTTPILGVQPASDYLYYIICSPVAGYFERGFNPVRVATSETFVRAAVGGLGEAKAGANYAASLMAARQAKQEGYDQVVWLDAIEHRYIEEMGGMNIFFVYGDRLVTSPLTGSILPGITRDSILSLAPDMGLTVEEKRLDAAAVCDDIDKGKITEVFACGTAAVVTAIDVFAHKGEGHKVADGEPGEITKKLYETLTGIQTGKIEDPKGWTRIVA